MKKIVLTFLPVIIATLTFSQTKNKENGITRCGTMLRVEQMFESDPRLRTQAEQLSKITPSGPALSNYRTNAIVTIPVVVHVVSNTAVQNISGW